MKKLTILLVEDNEGDILLITEAFETCNLKPVLKVIKDGQTSINFLEQKHKPLRNGLPDIILLDINLPKINGHQVLKHIKTNPVLKHIPVIMFTTSSSEKDILSAYENHANCYITKPTEVDDFVHIINKIESFWTNYCQLPAK